MDLYYVEPVQYGFRYCDGCFQRHKKDSGHGQGTNKNQNSKFSCFIMTYEAWTSPIYFLWRIPQPKWYPIHCSSRIIWVVHMSDITRYWCLLGVSVEVWSLRGLWHLPFISFCQYFHAVEPNRIVLSCLISAKIVLYNRLIWKACKKERTSCSPNVHPQYFNYSKCLV